MNKKTEYAIGFGLLVLVLILGSTLLATPLHFARLLIGLGIGYLLARAAFGFAGTINRAFNTGSTKLMRAFMMLIILASFVTLIFAAIPASDVNPEFFVKYGHFIHPITLGTVIGSFMFGIGMSFAGGCASGVLTDLSVAFPKALLALIFFGMGFVISIPFGSKLPGYFVNESLIKSSPEVNGVFFPDLFKFDGFNGFLGAFILTIILAAIVIKLSFAYEAKRKREGTYEVVESELEGEKSLVHFVEQDKLTFYEKWFARPWSLWEGAIAMTLMYAALMGLTKSAWGVSGAFGFWFAKLATTLGLSKDALLNYVGNPEYLNPTIFTHQQSVQDMGIILGAFIALLTMGRLFKSFKQGLKISGKDAVLAIIGGLLMGLSIGLSKGCNAGGLFSPIVSFSLSGWIFLIFMGAGAVVGGKIKKSIIK